MELKRFRELKSELLKEWTEDDHDNKQIFYLIKQNFYKNLKFTAGSRPRFGYIEQFTPSEEIKELFGLPYTSSSGFGALWVTNTQAEADTKQFYLKFRAIAKDTQIINNNGRGASFWLDGDKYGQGLKVSSGSKYNEFYYFKFLNDSNKIELDEIPAPKKEYNGAKLSAQADKLRQKITKIAGDLLPLVEEFNDIKRTLYNETNDTDVHSFKLHSVAKYGIKD